VSDASFPSGILAAAPLDSWDLDAERIPLAVLPCLGPRYDRNGFPSDRYGGDAE